MRGRDQFLGVGAGLAGFVNEAALVGVGQIGKRPAQRAEPAAPLFEASIPDGCRCALHRRHVLAPLVESVPHSLNWLATTTADRLGSTLSPPPIAPGHIPMRPFRD